jgi:catechol 2,3-dioxygenase-like lactoylglutathione lyase family enzyme
MTAKVQYHDVIFRVADVPRSVAHYERLGFEIGHHDEHYAFASRDRLTIHLAEAEAAWEGARGRGAAGLRVREARGVARRPGRQCAPLRLPARAVT